MRLTLSPSKRIVVFIFLTFLSGACALAYEVLYVRALTTLLGDMFYVHAALLGTFLVGIGVGAKIAHRFIGWLYLFEILTGIVAIFLPTTLLWLSQQPEIANITSNPLLTIITTIGIVSIPSLLIGFSIPLFSAYIKANTKNHLAFQSVYQAYNVGALLGLLSVEFILVKMIGISSSLAVVGTINIFNGLVLIGIGATSKIKFKLVSQNFSLRLIIALILVSIGSSVFQMFFLKLSYLVFGPHRENFTLGLAVTILGIALGALWASRTRVRFELLLLLVPLFIGLIYLNYLPLLKLYLSTTPWERGSEFLVLLHKFVFGCSFALPPMILFGATLPTLMRSESDVAEESGHLIFIASLGNAAGYLAYVLLGHPYLETDMVLSIIAGMALLGAILVIGSHWSKAQITIAISGVFFICINMVIWQDRNFYLAQWVDDLKGISEVTIYKSGADSATLVKSPNYEWISYNGHSSIYITHSGKVDFAEIISGIILAINAPRYENSLVLGLGAGITAGTVAKLFEHTDVVEINKAFIDMMPEIDYVNMEIDKNPTADLYLTDGRAFLVGKENCYDAIVNSIPAPTYFSASKIYTVEFYRQIKKALKPDGIFNTWLAVPNMSEEGVEAILSALHKSFTYCELRLLRYNYFMVTCSDQPIKSRSFSDLPVSYEFSKQLQNILPSFNMNEFFEDIVLSRNIFENFVPRIKRENTDDDPVLEFMLVRNYELNTMGNEIFSEQQELFNIDPVHLTERNSPERFSRRAGVYYLYNRSYFKKNFMPILSQNDYYKEAWSSWKKNHRK